MKHSMKSIACVLSFIIAVAAFPITTHAAGIETTDKSNNVTVNGITYSISQTNQTIQVTAQKNGKIVDNCTAYLDQGYMLYKDNRTKTPSSTVSSVSWLNDIVKETSPSNGARMAAPTDTSWTKDGKYIYKPSITSLNPIAYKEHTAYYWFRNLGTKPNWRTLYIKKGMAVTQVVALIAALVSTVATCGMTAAEIFIVAAAIDGGTGALAGTVVSRTISPTVNVLATNYESKFTDSSGAGITKILLGSKITVSDPLSKYYNKVFYEQYCPQVSKNFDWPAYLYTFKGPYYRYPGLKAYVEL